MGTTLQINKKTEVTKTSQQRKKKSRRGILSKEERHDASGGKLWVFSMVAKARGVLMLLKPAAI